MNYGGKQKVFEKVTTSVLNGGQGIYLDKGSLVITSLIWLDGCYLAFLSENVVENRERSADVLILKTYWQKFLLADNSIVVQIHFL